MKRRLIFMSVWLGCALATLAGSVHAQAPGQRPFQPYRPYRPTLTRYLDYFRSYNDAPELGGALSPIGSPSYEGFVRPREILRQDLLSQERSLGDLSGRIDMNLGELENRYGRLQKEIADIDSRQKVRPIGASPTGTGASFLNHSRYFQLQR